MNNNVRFPFRFFFITFSWSWLIWTPLILFNLKTISFPDKLLSILTIPVVMIGVFGPLVGAIYCIRKEQGRGAVKRYLRGFLNFRLGWKAYSIPVFVLGGTTFIAWFAPEFFGVERLPMLLPSIWLFLPYLPFMILLGGGQEEFGWRGYALPILENKLGIWTANLILGFIWSCWHLPLWFITGISQPYMNFGGFILLMTGYSFILSWIRAISGDKPFAYLFAHGAANAFIPFMPTIIMQKNVPQPRFWIWVILTFIIGLVITAFRSKKAVLFGALGKPKDAS